MKRGSLNQGKLKMGGIINQGDPAGTMSFN